MRLLVEARQAARFLCRAAWRCLDCDTPWFAAETYADAVRLATEHDQGHR